MNANTTKEETEKTLALLDTLTKVESSPFFSTKQEARLERYLEANAKGFSWNVVLKPALLLLIIAINVLVSFTYLNKSKNTYSNRESMIQELSGTYFSSSSSSNNFTNQ